MSRAAGNPFCASGIVLRRGCGAPVGHGLGDGLLGWVSARASQEAGEVVAYLPRHGAYDLADRIVLNVVPEDGGDAGYMATFALTPQ